MINKAIAWIVFSSKDPQKVSLTVKGVLLGLVPVIITGFNLAHVDLPTDTLTTLVDAVVQTINSGLTIIAGVMTFWGMVRKIHLTVTGENQIVQ